MPVNQPNIYPASRVRVADIAGAFYEGRDRLQRNKLIERIQAQEDAELARQDQTRNLLADYTMPGATPEQRAANLNRLMAVNPDAAMRAVKFQQGQQSFAQEQQSTKRAEQKRQAQVMARRMQRILDSPNPAISLQLNRQFEQGDIVEQLVKDGVIDASDGIDDNEARRLAQHALDRVAPVAGFDAPNPEAFTLSPGEVRFAGGRQIAAVPGGADSGFTLSPGQTRFNATGAPVAALPGGNEPDQRAQKIAAVESQLRGRMDPQTARNTAVNIVDRNLDMEVIPETGNVLLVDRVNQTAVEIPLGGGGAPTPAPPAGATLYEQAELGTGPVSALAAAASIPSGIVGGPIAEETVEARQTLKTATQEMIRALAINPRFPVAEMERLQKEISLAPSILDNTALMQTRMQAIDQSLRMRLAQADRDADDTGLPRDVRQAQASNASAIRNFLAVLGVPNGQDAGGVPTGPESLPGFDQLTPAEQDELRRLHRGRNR